MGLLELIKKLTVARHRGFMFSQTNKLTIKFYSLLRYMNTRHYLKLQIPKKPRHCFRKLSQNHDYVQTHSNNRNNSFHFACRKSYLYNNPQCEMV